MIHNKVLTTAIGTAALAVLTACGGGGGSAGTSPFQSSGSGTTTGTGSGSTGTGTGSTGTGTTSPTSAPTIALALSNTVVTSAAPVTVTATLKNSAGAPIPNQVVTFASTRSLGALSATTGLTNASGQAVVTLTPAASTTIGADTVTATLAIDAYTVTASAGFQLTATNVTISNFASDLGTSALSAYGQTTLTVNVTGAASGSSVNVGLTSACVTAGKASLSPATATTTTGTATFIYKDTGGCGSILASDTLQASVTGSSISQSLPLGLTSPAASSLAFVSASPETIFIKGSGYVPTSTISFKVVDVANNPLPGQSITLAATTYTGGLTLDGVSTPITKTSDANGLVTVLVNSGTVPTPVRVKATLANGAISTSSSNLSVAVGLPSQNGFSLSQRTINIEGLDIDGTSNTYTIIASDRMGNPVPAGTSVNFVAEGGQIQGVGQIAVTGGLASTSVAFQSATPKPADGRVTIVAYAIGEESFLDLNGDNVYSPGEDFQDLGDIFVSRPFNNVFNAAANASATPVISPDQRIPQSTASAKACVNSTSPILTLDRASPSVNTGGIVDGCDGNWGSAYVRRAAETVLSTSGARPLWIPGQVPTLSSSCAVTNAGAATSTKPTFYGDTELVPQGRAPLKAYQVGPGGFYNASGTTGSFAFIAADANPNRLNPMAAGTTVTVVPSANMSASITGGSPVPSTHLASAVGVTYTFTTPPVAPEIATGSLTLTFTSPSGVASSYTLFISTGAPSSGCGL